MAQDKGGTSSLAIGYSCAVIQAVLYSTIGIFCKLLYATGLDPNQGVLLRFSFTVIYLGVLLLIWRKYPLFSRKRNVYVQGVFFFLSAWAYLMAVGHMNAGLVIVVFFIYPVIVALVNALVFHEKLGWKTILALVLAICGVVLISGILEPHLIEFSLLGIALASLSGLAFAIYTVMLQHTNREDSSFTTTFSMSFLSLGLSLLVFMPVVPTTIMELTLQQVAYASGLSILATIAPIILFIIAVRHIGSTKAAILNLVETPAALFLAWLILGETLTLLQLLGAALVVASVFVLTVKGDGDAAQQDASEQDASDQGTNDA